MEQISNFLPNVIKSVFRIVYYLQILALNQPRVGVDSQMLICSVLITDMLPSALNLQALCDFFVPTLKLAAWSVVSCLFDLRSLIAFCEYLPTKYLHLHFRVIFFILAHGCTLCTGVHFNLVLSALVVCL